MLSYLCSACRVLGASYYPENEKLSQGLLRCLRKPLGEFSVFPGLIVHRDNVFDGCIDL